MDLLLAILISGASVFGGFLLLKSQGKRILGYMIHGESSDRLIGDGSVGKPKAKIFDKLPLSNPFVSNPMSSNPLSSNIGGVPSTPMNVGASRIPDMRGVNNGNSNLPAPQSTSVGMPNGGGGFTNVIGLANVVGVVSQNGMLKNNFAAGRQIVGAIFQGGNMVYTRMLKGTRRLNQMSNNMMNTVYGGRTTMRQGAGAQSIVQGNRINVRMNGRSNSNLYGGVKNIRGRLGSINTPNLLIKGISRAQTLVAKNFYAPKGTRVKMNVLANGGGAGYGAPMLADSGFGSNKRRLALPNYNNIGVNLNDINLQKNEGYSLQHMNYSINKQSNDYVTMVNMARIMKDSRNQGLNSYQRNRLYNLTRVRNSDNGENGYDSDDMFRQLVSSVPQLSNNDMRRVASQANRLRAQRRQNQEMMASRMANDRVDMNRESMNALNNLLKNTSNNAAAHFQNFIDENFKDDLKRNLSEKEIKDVEQRARENVNKRADIPLEQKEEEFEKEKEKLIGEKRDDELNVIEELVKERILANSEDAKTILGEEASEDLQKELNNIVEDKEKIKVQELIKQDLNAHGAFLKNHPEYNGKKYDEVYKARKQEEMQGDLQTAIGQLYSQRGKSKINQYGNNMDANNTQPNQNRIYMPMLANGGV